MGAESRAAFFAIDDAPMLSTTLGSTLEAANVVLRVATHVQW